MLAEFEGAPNVMHVSPGGGPVTPHDGTSWDKAYATIADALAPNGTRSNVVVLVAPGTYAAPTGQSLCEIHGSNVSIIGAGPGTLLTSDVAGGAGVVKYTGNNITVQDLQIRNTSVDTNTFSHVAIGHLPPVAPDITAHNLTLCRCLLHGEGGVYLLSTTSSLFIDNIHTGFENAAITGRYPPVVGLPEAEHTTISSNTVYRIKRDLFDQDSPAFHLVRGVLTALNCSFGTIAGFDDTSVTKAYRGILLQKDNSQMALFGCSVGVNVGTGVTSNGASFNGIACQDNCQTLTVGCLVRAKGPTNETSNVASFKRLDPSATISPHWTLAIPPYSP